MTVPEPIESFLTRFGFDFDVVAAGAPPNGRAEDGRDAAWTTTRVFISGHTPILAVHGRGRRINPQRLHQLAESATLREANRQELAQLYPFADALSTPPLGPLYGHQVFVDEELGAHENVVFAAGTPSEAIRMKYRDFVALVHPVVGSFTESRAGSSAG